jgi:hypothetical protein
VARLQGIEEKDRTIVEGYLKQTDPTTVPVEVEVSL